MQVTSTISGPRIPKRVLAAAAAIVAAALLGGVGAYATKGVVSESATSGGKAGPTQSAASNWATDSYRTQRGGLQLGEAPAPVQAPATPELRVLRVGSQI